MEQRSTAEGPPVPAWDASGDKAVVRSLRAGVDKALAVQRPAIVAHVARIRGRHPGASVRELVAALEKEYLATVATLGAASGGAAAAPGVGTSVSVALSTVEIGSFLEATALFTLAVAEVHGVPVDDLDKRRALVLAVLLGHSGSAAVEKAAGRTGAHWGKLLVQGMPVDKIHAVNRVLGHNFVTKYGTTQGVLVLGRAVPFGIGAALGAGGNAALGYASVKAARRAFGTDTPEITDSNGRPLTQPGWRRVLRRPGR